MKKVLFICKNNSGRSQMAEALLRNMYGEYYKVYSAGIEPKDINPLTVKVMEEIGINMEGHKSKSIEEFHGKKFDIIVSVCEDACPTPPEARKYIHVKFPDPRGSDIETFRKIRDQIKKWIEKELKPESMKSLK
ncbi:arsenate reductase ArsC [Methanothermobacter tenebrarum]|uniref:Arsenate reductase ArsC n=1 Tax=Methanothermobacter tenebrarum TaxID=680118 RepID=A0A328PCX1_9EURY|nr:arsenate reductase ArsC [Methanothermobacter tenebrarum]NPV64731.1 arsenate reductase ArsC [Methanobacteriaceae archaeon]RAO79061.1 arsenate reductase ArsC [Methanothermobacter tenebrarum]